MKNHKFPVFKLSKEDFRSAFGSLAEEERLPDMGMSDLAWFDSYKEDYEIELQTMPDFWPNEPMENLKLYFAPIFPKEMQDRMVLVGRGMEKVAFVFGSGVCFKFQYQTRVSSSQTKAEIREALRWPGLTCFPKLFSYADHGLCLACETAMQPSEQDFRSAFGVSPDELKDAFVEYFGLGERAKLEAITRSVKSGRQRKILEDLTKFQGELFSRTGSVLEDLKVKNWGMTRRNSEPAVILTDYAM